MGRFHLCKSLRAAAAASAGPPSAAAAPRPTVVIDLDETILHRHRGALDKLLLYTVPQVRVGVPYASAVTALEALAPRYRFAAVTARWRLAERSTAAWLAHHGLAHVPVIYAGDWHPGDGSRAGFKAAAIAHLREAGWAPAYGVGDRPSDLQAYTRQGLRALMVAHAHGVRPGDCAAQLKRLRDTELAEPRAPGSAAADVAAAASSGSTAHDALARSSAAQPSLPRSWPPPVIYFTDDAAVHAAPGSLGLAHVTLAQLLADGPPEQAGAREGAAAGAGWLFSPGAAAQGSQMPPVWSQIHSLLDAEAEARAAHMGGDRVGTDSFADEAAAHTYLRPPSQMA